jgi:hypothetical protein
MELLSSARSGLAMLIRHRKPNSPAYVHVGAAVHFGVFSNLIFAPNLLRKEKAARRRLVTI